MILAQLAPQVQLAWQVKQDKLVLLATQEQPGLAVPLVKRVQKVILDQADPLATQDQPVRLVQLALVDPQAKQVQAVTLVLLDLQA